MTYIHLFVYVRTDGCVLAWGRGDLGQLGRLFPAHVKPRLKQSSFPQVVDFTSVFTDPSMAELLDADFKTRVQVTGIACGSEHSFCMGYIQTERVPLSYDNAPPPDSEKTLLIGFGWNEHGNLGVGHTVNVSRPCLVSLNGSAEQTGDHEMKLNSLATGGASVLVTLAVHM